MFLLISNLSLVLIKFKGFIWFLFEIKIKSLFNVSQFLYIFNAEYSHSNYLESLLSL